MLFTAFYDALSCMVRWYLDIEDVDLINQKITEYHEIRKGDCTYESGRKNDTISRTNVYLKKCIWYNIDMEKDIFNGKE